MTTIATNLKEMAADTQVSWDGIGVDRYAAIKLFVAKEGNPAVYGITGGNCEGSLLALEWLQGARAREMRPNPPDYDHNWDWRIIELSPEGISIYNERLERETSLEPFLAVGSGRKVAMYCMKHLKMSPAEAVREACKVDSYSNLPIYIAKLGDTKIVRWIGASTNITKRKRDGKTKKETAAKTSQVEARAEGGSEVAGSLECKRVV